jgi:hypothetical protein
MQMKSLLGIATLFTMLISSTIYGQDYYFITAKNGLNVRSGSDLSSAKVAKIPFGAMIEKIEDTEKELVVNDNGKEIKGKFVKIKYNNYTYLVSEETDSFEREGYVFDGYLKKVKNDGLVAITQLDKATYIELEKKASKETHKPKAMRNLDAIKRLLKNRVVWVTEFESGAYVRNDVLKSITAENGQKLVFNQNSYDYGFSEGHSAYFPLYDILVLDGGHSSDVSFSIKTGETDLAIGNPEYICASPNNSYRLNGLFGGQECISYFFQKNENGKFVYLTALNSDLDICTFKAFYWISETSFIYTTGNYLTDTEDGTDEYFRGEIKDDTGLGSGEIETTKNFYKESEVSTKTKALQFIKHLEEGESLSSFFNENWLLIYYTDNRCDGATEGQVENLKSTQIDSIIGLRVTNDGDAWLCDKKEPSSFDFSFDIKKQVANWDRFEILESENQEDRIVYVLGAGQSDYLKLFFNEKNLIIKLEYRSEDPG